MQRKEFENRIKSLLPKAADNVVESWAEYATELDQDGTEAAADFYDKNYIALLLVKQRRGEEIATQLFNFGKHFTFNYFELQGAAEKIETLKNGGRLVNFDVEIFKGRYDSSSYSIFNYLARQYGVKIPIKTQGWINSSLLDITVKDGKMSGGHMSGKNQSTVIYKYMNQLIEAVRKDA